MSSCDNSNIKKNYIVTSTETDILSACTGFYTNDIYPCTGDTIIVHSDILSANTINSSVFLSGGTNLLDIFGGYGQNTFITGFTYDNSNNLSIQRNDGVSFDVNISEFSGLTINGVLSACTGIYTSNIYGCSPITIQDELILKSGLTFNTIPINNSLEKVLVIDSGGTINYRELSTITGGSGTNTFVTGFTYNNSNTFTIKRNDDVSLSSTINNVTGFTINGDLTISGNTNISETPQIDTNPVLQLLTRDSSSGDVKIKPVPNTLNYGLFSQTGDSLTISATTTESSIVDGGSGTLSVPANGFSIGDSFHAILGGIFSNNNGQTIRIRLKSGSVVLADSGVQTLTSHTNAVFKLSVDFTIRNIGVAGTASIVTLGSFQSIKKNSANLTGFGFDFTNNTTFDTTITNTLDITVQWGSTSTSNQIKTKTFVLNKTY